MKRVLSLVLALVLVLGMIPTFAADMTAGQHLFEHEFIAGDGLGNLNEDQLLTREQLAKLVLELNGSKEEAEALTLPPSYTDSAKISAWARPYVAYAQIEGLMKGYTDNTFRPQVGVNGQQLAQVLTRALGYEFSWETVIADAADLGIEVASAATLTRGQAFEAMWTTVNTKPEGEETLTLGQLLGKIDPPVVVPVVDIAVASVKADNLAEIVVTFNKAVDETTAENEANYLLDGVALNALDVATLQEDGMTVIINKVGAPLVNQTEYELTVKNVLDTTEKKVATTKKDFTAFDSTIPQALSVEVTGPKTFKVNFSEPLQSIGTFKVDAGQYYASPVLSADQKSVTLTVGVALTEGAHTITAENATDFYGFKIAKTTLDFTYVKDTAIPTATVSSATETVVTLVFDKAVSTANLNTTVTAYYGYNKTAGFQGNLAAVSPVNGYAKKFTITFGNPIPQGSHTLYLNTAADKLQDAWGNDVPTQTFPITVVVDDVAPTVVSVVAESDEQLVVTFSENINSADAVKKANYTLLNSANVVIKTGTFADVDSSGHFNANATLSYDADSYEVTIDLTNNLPGGTYYLKIENVRDASYKLNKMVASSTAFDVTDETAPQLSSATVNSNGSKIRVTFNESMNVDTLTKAADYRLVVNNAANSSALPSGSTVTVVNDKTVEITLGTANANIDGTSDFIQASGSLKDVAGNSVGGFFAQVAIGSDSIGVVDVDSTGTTSYVVATNKTTLEVVVNKELKAIDASKIIVNGAPASSAYYTNDNGESTVTLILGTELATDISDLATVTFQAAALTNIFGTTNTQIALSDVNEFVDEIVPEILTVEQATTTSIVVTFSEAMDTNTASIYTFGVEGETVSAIAWSAGDTVLTLTTSTMTSGQAPAVTQLLDLKDLEGNVLVKATDVVDTDDTTVPTATVTAVSNNANTAYAKTGDTITVTVVTSEAYKTGTPAITIAGSVRPVVEVDDNTFTATYVALVGDAEGEITVAVNFKDASENSAVQITQATVVMPIFDKTAPTAIAISAQDTIAAAGSVTLTATNGPLSDASWTAILNQIKANTATGGNWITGIAAADLTMVVAADGITAAITNGNAGAATLAADFVITAANVVDRAGNVAAGNITIDAAQ